MLCFPPATTDFSLATVSLTNVVGVRQIRDKNIQIAVINSKGTLSSPSPKDQIQALWTLDNLGNVAKKNYAAALAQQCKAIPNVGLGLAISTVSLTTILWFPARNLLYIPHKQCNLSLIAPITDNSRYMFAGGVNIGELIFLKQCILRSQLSWNQTVQCWRSKNADLYPFELQ